MRIDNSMRHNTLSIPLFINYTSARFCHSYSSDICIVHNINCCHSLICTIRSLNLWLHEHLISMLAMHNPHTWLATNGSNFHVNKIKYPWWKISMEWKDSDQLIQWAFGFCSENVFCKNIPSDTWDVNWFDT